jgi:NADH pyrophosphatase NudC (nudix superfamily)
MKARYCSQCGGPIHERLVGDRVREVCTVCETVFYQNPLPAAAALVLDENRRGQRVVTQKHPK